MVSCDIGSRVMSYLAALRLCSLMKKPIFKQKRQGAKIQKVQSRRYQLNCTSLRRCGKNHFHLSEAGLNGNTPAPQRLCQNSEFQRQRREM